MNMVTDKQFGYRKNGMVSGTSEHLTLLFGFGDVRADIEIYVHDSRPAASDVGGWDEVCEVDVEWGPRMIPAGLVNRDFFPVGEPFIDDAGLYRVRIEMRNRDASDALLPSAEQREVQSEAQPAEVKLSVWPAEHSSELTLIKSSDRTGQLFREETTF